MLSHKYLRVYKVVHVFSGVCGRLRVFAGVCGCLRLCAGFLSHRMTSKNYEGYLNRALYIYILCML